MSELKLGQIIEGEAHRDATHIAVAPVTADCLLFPGQNVGLVPGTTDRVTDSDNPIGIVDPFLRHQVSEGTRFYLWLYPQTVTGMRHEWEHPAFDGANESVSDKSASESWIRRFAEGINQTYSNLMVVAACYVEHGDYEYDNSEDYKAPEFGTWPEFWKHYEIVTGTKVKEDERWAPFTCSC